jgi:quercetin dioxygenase-like cupin family protein
MNHYASDRQCCREGIAMKVVKLSELPSEAVNTPLFTGGDVSRQTPFEAAELTNMNFGVVSFASRARNKMHRHTSDQILIITEGTGVVATTSEERTVSAGDVILIPAGEDHWHGAPGETAMTHITIQAKGSTTTQIEE